MINHFLDYIDAIPERHFQLAMLVFWFLSVLFFMFSSVIYDAVKK